MPYKKPKIEKIYYSIGEVSEMFGVNASMVRFWDKEFDIIKPHKNKKGNRLFTPQDIEGLRLIYHLVKERGMTLAGAKKKLKDNREDTMQNFEVVCKLNEIKDLLLEIRNELDNNQQ
jgi:DNA-binding transcriptional MerR regulator